MSSLVELSTCTMKKRTDTVKRFSNEICGYYVLTIIIIGLVKITNGKVTKLGDFNNLKSQITKVNPKGVSMDSYTPSNTKARDCPTEGEFWEASSNLPPTPDQSLCACMVKSLECVAKDSVPEKGMGDLFGFVCGQPDADCSGITANGTTGVYGAFSMCSSSERLSWAFNSVSSAMSSLFVHIC